MRAVASLLCVLLSVGVPLFLLLRLLRSPRLWELSIRAFERQPAIPRAVVFIGSSSIRRWTTLPWDMAPLSVLNRGFGGATMVSINHYARRILARAPDPRALVLYGGPNDLAWGFTVERVFQEIARFVDIAGEVAPGAPIYVVSVQPTPSRSKTWGAARDLNARLESFAARSAGRVRFVDVASAIVDASGRPRRELFVFDGIHMNAGGYAIWTSIVRPRLLHDLAGAAASSPHSREAGA